MPKILTVLGTRPEAIKLAPVIRQLHGSRTLQSEVCATAQHRRMLDQVLEVFGIEPDYDLDLMRDNQDLCGVTARIVSQMAGVIEQSRPDLVLVQGDTTTTFAASLAAFYAKVPVGHVEAGLRTYDKSAPFPEEVNRRLTTVIAELHFAPTQRAAENLYSEGIPGENVFVTGNTVVDALRSVVDSLEASGVPGRLREEQGVPRPGRRVVLITGHRRESFGQGFRNICTAIRRLAAAFPECDFVYPVHLNPNVRTAVESILQREKQPNVFLLEPLEYLPFLCLLRQAYLVLTDSGGVQEEAITFGKPILVMRETTERPEGVQAGAARLVGNDAEVIFDAAQRLLENQSDYRKMADRENPYGDGKAAGRIVAVLERVLVGRRVEGRPVWKGQRIESLGQPRAGPSSPKGAGQPFFS